MEAKRSNLTHDAVMPNETIESLAIDAGGIYVDATYGRGGHSSAILERLGRGGRLIAFDCDSEAIRFARSQHVDDERFEAVEACFSEIEGQLLSRHSSLEVSGIIADLGVSSPQLDEAERGFSFMHDGPLDMRMNPHRGVSAEAWLKTVNETALAEVLRTFGEERYSGRIARAIVEARNSGSLRSTKQLAELISNCVPSREKKKHPATRTFLAIRMQVNQELEKLERFLPQCINLLADGGRLVIITFHSVEDRLVKRFIRDACVGAPGPQGVPFRNREFRPTLKRVGKIKRPSTDEIRVNRRSRSAVMRVAERIGVHGHT